jgi:hypothetical protein
VAQLQIISVALTRQNIHRLNVSELELSAMTKQSLNRRIGRIDVLKTDLSAWEHELNSSQKGVDWQFTTPDDQTKPRRLYPQIQI